MQQQRSIYYGPGGVWEHVDIRSMNFSVVKKWIAARISTILGFDDDVVSGIVIDMLEGGVRAFFSLCMTRHHHRIVWLVFFCLGGGDL